MSDSSFLEYLYETHKSQLNRPSDYLALLCHSMLLDRKVKLKNGKAILSDDWNQTDPIRLVYLSEDGAELNVSVIETAGDAFISVTESKNDQLGHLEVSVDDFVDTSPNLSLEQSYPQLKELKKRFEENIWAVIFPPKEKTPKKNPEFVCAPFQSNSHRRSNPLIDDRFSGPPNPFDYGRRDLDPFGINDPLRQGPSVSGGMGGGMFFDPRRPSNNGRPLYPGAAPLGARIDPIYPFPGNPSRGRHRPPDPDMPTPPGWEDMYL